MLQSFYKYQKQKQITKKTKTTNDPPATQLLTVNVLLIQIPTNFIQYHWNKLNDERPLIFQYGLNSTNTAILFLVTVDSSLNTYLEESITAHTEAISTRLLY